MDETLRTRTTVMFSDAFVEDEVWLNGKKLDLSDKDTAERMQQLNVIREKAGIKAKAKIVSLNCFPTAAGFASSAAGMAALACAASKAAGLNLSSSELSILARLGSGSACRSVLGGFVEWKRGVKSDGSDSIAVEIAPATHWPEIRNVIAIVDQGKKKISSRAGMKQTVATSGLYPKRIQDLPKTLETVRNAILRKDLPTLLEATMRESSNMHAVMLDTWPSIVYFNDISKQIMATVVDFNNAVGEIRAGYTFDAGPNAHVYTVEKHVPEVKKLLGEIEGVQKIIICKAGPGPKYINEHLLNSDGSIREHHYDEASGKIIVK
jgi:diphosphomevalonate decarboxylase